MTITEKAIRILIVDDHPLFRRGVRAVIDNEPDMEVIAEAGNGREAIAAFTVHRPDLTLMDLRMPEMNGVEAIKVIRETDPHARILVLTTSHGDVEIRRAFDAGAKGYLLKNSVADDMAAAVHAVAIGKSFVPADVAQVLNESLLAQRLTARELTVLTLVYEGHSNASIGRELAVSEETVKTHMSNIMGKLRARDRTHAVTIALDRGIITGKD